MDHHEGAGPLVSAGSLTQSVFQDVWVEIPSGGIAVEKNRLGPQVADRIAARGEGEGGAKDLVAGTDPEEAQSEMDGGRAGAQGNRGEPDAILEFPLEGRDIGADRGQPVRGESLADVGLFGPAHVRHGEQDAFHRMALGSVDPSAFTTMTA